MIVYRTLGNSLAWLAAEPDYTFFQKVRPTVQDVFTVDATPVRSKVRFLCETVLLDAIRSVLLESIPPSIWIARNWDPSRRFAARGSVLPAGERSASPAQRDSLRLLASIIRNDAPSRMYALPDAPAGRVNSWPGASDSLREEVRHLQEALLRLELIDHRRGPCDLPVAAQQAIALLANQHPVGTFSCALSGVRRDASLRPSRLVWGGYAGWGGFVLLEYDRLGGPLTAGLYRSDGARLWMLVRMPLPGPSSDALRDLYRVTHWDGSGESPPDSPQVREEIAAALRRVLADAEPSEVWTRRPGRQLNMRSAPSW